MIRRILAAFLLVASGAANAQYMPLFSAVSPAPRVEEAARKYGGVSIDFANGRFLYVPSAGAAVTSYASLGAMVTGLGGAISLPAKNCYAATGYLITTTANTPTVCYDGTGQNPGLWIEGARTNSALWSEDLTNAVWAATGVVNVNNGAWDPRGTTNATTLRENATTGKHWVVQTLTKSASALNYTLSAWAYQRNGDRCLGLYADDNAGNGVYAIFQTNPNADDGLQAIVGPVTIGSGFAPIQTFARPTSRKLARFALALTTNAATTLRIAIAVSDCTSLTYTGDNKSSIAVWGVQAEQSTVASTEIARYPTSYMFSNGTAGSRALDSVAINAPSAWASAPAWSLYALAEQPQASSGSNNFWLTVDDNTASTNRIGIYKANSGFQSAQAYAGGSLSFARVLARVPYGAMGGLACGFDASGYSCQDNYGQTSISTVAATMPTGITKIHVGQNATSANYAADARIQKIGVIPARIGAGEAQAFATPLIVGPADTPDLTNFFGPNSINSVLPAVGSTFFVTQQAPPPASDSVGASSCTATTPGCWQMAWPFFPMSVAETQNIKAMVASTWTGSTSTTSCNPACPISGEHFIWVNHIPRVSVGDLPNPTFPSITSSSGNTCRPVYTTYARSDAATAAQLAFSAGWGATETGGNAGKGYLDITRAAGIPDAQVMGIDAFAALAADSSTDPCTGTMGTTIGTFSTVTDYVLLPQARLVDATIPMRGFRIDAEMFDSRTPAQVTALYTQLLGLIQPAKNGTTYKLSTYNDDLTSGIAQYTGITAANICTLLSMGAEFSVTAQLPNPQNDVMASVAAQVAFVQNACGSFPYAKHRLIYRLGVYPSGTSLTDAQNINAELRAHPWGSLEIQRMYAKVGGTCGRFTTQRLAAAFGITGCP